MTNAEITRRVIANMDRTPGLWDVLHDRRGPVPITLPCFPSADVAHPALSTAGFGPSAEALDLPALAAPGGAARPSRLAREVRDPVVSPLGEAAAVLPPIGSAPALQLRHVGDQPAELAIFVARFAASEPGRFNLRRLRREVVTTASTPARAGQPAPEVEV